MAHYMATCSPLKPGINSLPTLVYFAALKWHVTELGKLQNKLMLTAQWHTFVCLQKSVPTKKGPVSCVCPQC